MMMMYLSLNKKDEIAIYALHPKKIGKDGKEKKKVPKWLLSLLNSNLQTHLLVAYRFFNIKT